jgi:hypothetical protein
MEPTKRKSGPHYTNVQRDSHGGILLTYDLNDLIADKHLVENLAIKLSDARKELAALKAKSIWAIAWERIRGK